MSETGQSNGLKHTWKSTNTTIEKEDQCTPLVISMAKERKHVSFGISTKSIEREQNRKNKGGLATGAGPYSQQSVMFGLYSTEFRPLTPV